jgi:hypothetical protein
MTHQKFAHMIYSFVLGFLFLVSVFLLSSSPQSPARAIPVNLFVTPGGGGDCSQANPCDLQTALDNAFDYDTLYVAQGSYTGSGDVVISLTKSIKLVGGWDGSPEGMPIRDPVTYTSTLDGEGFRRVIYVGESTTPTIDGFTITRGNATGLGGGTFDDGDAGGGIYSLNAAPVLQNNTISNNIASSVSVTRSFGGGIYIKSDSFKAVVSNNDVISNSAGIDTKQGDGGGLYLYSRAIVKDNNFQDNKACSQCPHSYGGGLYIAFTTSGCDIINNTFENNQAFRGGGLLFFWSAIHLTGNTIIKNTATDYGGGVLSWYDGGSEIDANTILSNTAVSDGGGVLFRVKTGSELTLLSNNIIASNKADRYGGGVYAYSDWHIAAISMTHNTLVDNGTALAIGNNMTVTFINNIVANHNEGLSVLWHTGHITADHNLFWFNTIDGITGTNAVFGDPAFVNPVLHDYHIQSVSAAVDNGVNAGVAGDIDGDARPVGKGFDIGADEYVYSVYIPLALRNTQP